MLKKVVGARATVDEVLDCLAALQRDERLPPRPAAAIEAEEAAAAAEAELARRRAARNPGRGGGHKKHAPLAAKAVKADSAAGRRRMLRGVSPPTVLSEQAGQPPNPVATASAGFGADFGPADFAPPVAGGADFGDFGGSGGGGSGGFGADFGVAAFGGGVD